MLVKIFPSSVKGSLKAPASKSCTQRALAAALLTPGKSIIENAGKSNDENAARNIIRKLGAEVTTRDHQLIVSSTNEIFTCNQEKKSVEADCGESGLSMRMFAPIASLFNYDITLTGKGSILTRPMDFLDKYLPQLGINVNSNSGKVPVTIRGPLKPKNITISGAQSSQFLTGLLFAFCKAATEPVTIHVDCLNSRPYIDLSISVLEKFGFQVENDNYESFHIIPRLKPPVTPVKYTVEGDWSNAAFILVAGAISGEVSLSGMDLNSTQGDKKILEALYECGAKVLVRKDSILVNNENVLNAFQFDATHCPDLFPPLVVLAANCKGTSEFTGVNRLLHKESNRAIALRDEFKKMNVDIELQGDLMKIHGGKQIKAARISSHNDHRIAMAATIAALKAKGVMEISEAEAVDKSYPDFYHDMNELGIKISY